MNRKLIALLLAVLTLVSVSCAYAVPYSAYGADLMVKITAECADYNHVGDDWYEYYALNGYDLLSGDTVYLRYGDKFSLYSRLSEKDLFTYDIGECYDSYTVNESYMLTDGFTITQYLTVSEDSGLYNGYWCEWYVTYEFIPVY